MKTTYNSLNSHRRTMHYKQLLMYKMLGCLLALYCTSVCAQNNLKSLTMIARDFTTTIVVDKTPKQVFDAINNVRGWWSEDIEGRTDKLNSVFNYHYKDVHRSKMKIIELVPGKKVVWLVLDNQFNFTKDKSEWKGNKIVFQISSKNKLTTLQFTQIGLVPEYECYDICKNAWSNYIEKSLRSLITTGKGEPNRSDNPKTADEKKLGSRH